MAVVLVAVGKGVVGGGQGDRQVDRVALTPDGKIDCIAPLLTLEQLGEEHVIAVECDVAVVGDGVAVDFEQHIAYLQMAHGIAEGVDIVERHAGGILGQRQALAQGTVACGQEERAQLGVAVVGAVGDIGQEVFDHRQGNRIANVVGPGQSLEGEANDALLEKDGAAAVAGVDGRIDLQDEVLVDSAVRVATVVDARDHPARDRDTVAAGGIAQHGDLVVQRGNGLGQAERRDVFEESGVVDGQRGQVAVMCDESDAREVAARLPVARHLKKARVGDHVRIGQNASLGNHEPGPCTAARPAGLPGRGVVLGLEGGVDLDHAAQQGRKA